MTLTNQEQRQSHSDLQNEAGMDQSVIANGRHNWSSSDHQQLHCQHLIYYQTLR